MKDKMQERIKLAVENTKSQTFSKREIIALEFAKTIYQKQSFSASHCAYLSFDYADAFLEASKYDNS